MVDGAIDAGGAAASVGAATGSGAGRGARFICVITSSEPPMTAINGTTSSHGWSFDRRAAGGGAGAVASVGDSSVGAWRADVGTGC